MGDRRTGFSQLLARSIEVLASVERGALGVLGKTLDIKVFDLSPGPGSAPEELETGSEARIHAEATDWNPSAEFLPSELFLQVEENHFESHAVQRVIGIRVGHQRLRFGQRGVNGKESFCQVEGGGI